MRPDMSCIVAKLALPITRLSIMRPGHRDARSARPPAPRWLAVVPRADRRRGAVRRKSLGKALPCSRSAFSFARRSAMIWFSSLPGRVLTSGLDGSQTLSGPDAGIRIRAIARSHALLQAGGDELVEIAVEHAPAYCRLDVGAQVLDARLVEHVGADLVAPADVGLVSSIVCFSASRLLQLDLVQLRLAASPWPRRGCGAASGRSGIAPRCWSAGA